MVEFTGNDIVLISRESGYNNLKYNVDKYLAIKLRSVKGTDISSKLEVR
ncbi:MULTISPECIES: hypothetical protein [Clostridium]|nr:MULTISPECIES: hypothetical protein [Clostridium]